MDPEEAGAGAGGGLVAEARRPEQRARRVVPPPVVPAEQAEGAARGAADDRVGAVAADVVQGADGAVLAADDDEGDLGDGVGAVGALVGPLRGVAYHQPPL